MLKRLLKTTTALVGLAFISLAIAKAPVEGHIEAFIVSLDDKGSEVAKPAKSAEPGNLMEYRLTFTNNGDSSVSGLKVVDPIPENTTFVSESARTDVSALFEVSIDGGRSFEQEPVVRIETQADGSQKQVVIPASHYTHIRWAVADELQGKGGKHAYAYRVVVD